MNITKRDYANTDLRAWVATGGFLDDDEMQSALSSDLHKKSPAFRAATLEKVRLMDDRDTRTQIRVGTKENRAVVQTGTPEETEAHADQQGEYAANLAELVAREGPQAGPPPKAETARARLKINGSDIN